MPNKQIVFCDRVVGVSMQNGLVRLDLAVNAGTGKDKDDKPVQRMEVTSQLVMPLDAFINAVAMQDRLIKELAAREKKARGAKAPAASVEPAAG